MFPINSAVRYPASLAPYCRAVARVTAEMDTMPRRRDEELRQQRARLTHHTPLYSPPTPPTTLSQSSQSYCSTAAALRACSAGLLALLLDSLPLEAMRITDYGTRVLRATILLLLLAPFSSSTITARTALCCCAAALLSAAAFPSHRVASRLSSSSASSSQQ